MKGLIIFGILLEEGKEMLGTKGQDLGKMTLMWMYTTCTVHLRIEI